MNNSNFSIQYSIPLGTKNKIIIRPEHEHRGKLYWHPNNVDVQPATEFINFRLTFKHKGKLEWKVGLYGNNLLNTDYSGEYFADDYTSTIFGDLKWPGNPRVFGVNFAMKF